MAEDYQEEEKMQALGSIAVKYYKSGTRSFRSKKNKNFKMKAGDKVVCINDNNLYPIPVKCICEGIIYTLTEVFTCKCGNVYVRLKEVKKAMNMWCPKCNIFAYTIMYFHIERFRLLDKAENSEREFLKTREPVPTL